MKKWTNEKYTTIAIYTVIVVTAALLFLFAILNFGKILSFLSFLLFSARSVVYGILLALILYPLSKRLEHLTDRYILKKEKAKKFCRPLAVTVTFLILLLIVGIIVLSVVPMVHENYTELSDTIKSYIDSAIKTIQQNEFVYNIFLSITGITGGDSAETLQTLINRYSSFFSGLASSLVTILLTAVYSMSDLLIAVILAFYFLLAREYIHAVARKLSNALLPKRMLSGSAQFFRSFYTNIMEFLSARIVCSLTLGVLCYFAAWILSVPFHPLLSMIAFVLNMIPVLGPIAAVLLCSLIVFILNPSAVWIFLLLMVAFNIAEQYLIEHYLLSRRLRPGVAIVLIVEIIAYIYTGFGGMILAVPVFVTLRAQFQILINRRLYKKGLSLSTADYMSAESVAEMTAPPPPPVETEADTSAEADPEQDTETAEAQE